MIRMIRTISLGTLSDPVNHKLAVYNQTPSLKRPPRRSNAISRSIDWELNRWSSTVTERFGRSILTRSETAIRRAAMVLARVWRRSVCLAEPR